MSDPHVPARDDAAWRQRGGDRGARRAPDRLALLSWCVPALLLLAWDAASRLG